ncbi:hypothetical protein ACHAWF_018767 [Thalassiosira exigua]
MNSRPVAVVVPGRRRRRRRPGRRPVASSSAPPLLLVRAVLLAFLAVAFLPSSIRPAVAIGGWEQLHLFLGRWRSEEARARNAAERGGSGKGTSSPKSSPRPAAAGSDDEKKDGDGGAGKKKRHVGEVTMTSWRTPEDGAAEGAAFVPRGRRAAATAGLDEDDLSTIAFVGRSNPFL